MEICQAQLHAPRTRWTRAAAYRKKLSDHTWWVMELGKLSRCSPSTVRARDPSTGLSQPKHKSPKHDPCPRSAESCNPIWCTSPDGEGGTDCYAGGPDGEGGSEPCTCSVPLP